MPQALEEISDNALLESGIWKSVDVLKAPLWIDGLNVDFRKGQVEKARGWEVEVTAEGDVQALAQAFVNGEKRLYLGRDGSLGYYVPGQEIYDIRSSGLSPGRWSLLAWGKFLIATNGVDRLQFWNNSGLAVDITDGITKADFIRGILIYVMAFNADGEIGRVKWCVGGNPTVWTPDLDNNDAGGFYIRNVSSLFTAAGALGGNIIVFTQTQPFLIQYVGGNQIFAYQDMQLELGAIGEKCVTSDGVSLFGLDRRGFWRTDGVQVQWLADPMLWDYFKARIDFDRGEEVVGYYNRLRATIEWSWKTLSGASEGWAYSLTNAQWAPRSYGLDCAIGDGVFDTPIGSQGPDVLNLGVGVNAGTDALTSFIQTKPLPLKSTEFYKWLDEIRFRKSGLATLEIGVSESPDDAIEWLPAEVLAERHFPEREAAFFTLRFSSTAVDADWSVAGMEFFGKYTGGRIGQ